MRKILQVTKYTGVPRQMLYAEGLSKFLSKKVLKTPILEKLLLGANLQVPSIKVRGLKCGSLAEWSLKVENVALSSTTVSYKINIVMYA